MSFPLGVASNEKADGALEGITVLMPQTGRPNMMKAACETFLTNCIYDFLSASVTGTVFI